MSDYKKHWEISEVGGIRADKSNATRCVVDWVNIVEELGRHCDRELHRYLKIAIGSSNELDYQLLVSKDYGA